MTKYILIGGGIHSAKDKGKLFCEEILSNFNKNKTIKILNCLFARNKEDWSLKFKSDKEFYDKNLNNFEIEFADPKIFIEQIKKSDVVFFQGGNPHLLMSNLCSTGDWIKACQGKTLIGTSAGADIFVKYYGVGKTSNIGEGLGILPIKFIPHWKSAEYEKKYDTEVDWENLLEKLKSYKEDLPLITVQEGEFIVFND